MGVNADANADAFLICHGFEMRIPTPTDISVPFFISSDAENCTRLLRNSIELLDKAVRMNRIENKLEIGGRA